jgi:hypothetical protein
MSDVDPIIVAVRMAIQAAWEDGCPVAGHPEETASLAVRRWRSAERRIKGKIDHESRIRDLTKGLVQFQEEDPDLVGPLKQDYRFLAEQIAQAIDPSTP